MTRRKRLERRVLANYTIPFIVKMPEGLLSRVASVPVFHAPVYMKVVHECTRLCV